MDETGMQTDTEDEEEIESKFDDLLLKSGRAFDGGDLETAELHVTSALKLVYYEKKEMKKMRKCFETLAHIYLERGKKSKNGEDFAKSTALYNATLCRLQIDELHEKELLISCIKDTEKQFLISIISEESKINVRGYEIELEHKALLEEIRRHCRNVILNLDANQNLEIKPKETENRVAAEAERTNVVRTLFQTISDGMTKFVKLLLDECVSVLGQAPCKYAVIGLGSLARQEMTPYSDLEFAIIVEEGTNTEENMAYFRNLTHYLHIKVINLGETILPTMGIVSLNDYCSKDVSRKWFYDDGPRGFCFDAAMPWASKMPLGRKKTADKDALELIKTPAEMAKLQQENVALKEGYHLADVLASSVLITGDEELFRVYNEKVNENLQAPSDSGDSWTNGSRRGFFSLHETSKDFCLDLDWHESGRVFNVKKEFYRFPSLVVSGLCLYCNLNTCVTWDAVEEMHERKLINSDMAHNLRVALAIASEFRLRTYLAKGSQRERITPAMPDALEPTITKVLTGLQDESKEEKVFHLSDTDIIARFLMTVLPLQNVVQELLLNESSPKQDKLLTEKNLYDDRAEIVASIYVRLLDFEKAKSSLEKAVSEIDEKLSVGSCTNNSSLFDKLSKLGDVYLELGNEQEALNSYEKATKVLEARHNGEIVANLEFGKSFSDRGTAYSLIGDNEKALEFFQKSLSTKLAFYGENVPNIEIVSSLQDVAFGYSLNDEVSHAIVFYEKAIKMINEIGTARLPTYYCTSLTSLLPLYTLQGDIQKAFDLYDELSRTLSTLYGTGVMHPFLASSLENLAFVHHEAGNLEQAVTLYDCALSISRHLYRSIGEHTEIVDLLMNLGHTHSRLSNHVTAIDNFGEALKMQRSMYRQHTTHPELAMTLCTLGNAYWKNGDVSPAKEMFEEGLKMFRLIHEDDFDNRDLCKVLINLGYVHAWLKENDVAVNYLEEACELWEKIYVPDEPHEDFVECLNHLGNLYRQLGLYEKAYQHCHRGLEIRSSLDERSESELELLAESLVNTGRCCSDLEDYENALSYYQRALSIGEEINVDVAELCTDVGTAYSCLKQPQQAIKYYKKAISLEEEKYGPGQTPDPILSRHLCTLGNEYMNTHEYDKAAEILEKCLEIFRRANSSSADLAETLQKMGITYMNLNRLEEGQSHLEEALAMSKSIYGENQPSTETSIILTNLGLVEAQLCHLDEALNYLQESLNMSRVLVGASTSDPVIPITLGYIGKVYYQRKEYDSAISYIQQALEMLESADSQSDHEIAFNLCNLAQAYECLPDLPAALACYEKALPLMIQVYGESHDSTQRVLSSLEKIRQNTVLEQVALTDKSL